MRFNPFMENPTNYARPVAYCAFRWCTKEAIAELWIHVAEVDVDDGETAAQLPVCKEHRDVIEKFRNKKGTR